MDDELKELRGERQPLKTLIHHKLHKNTHHRLSWKQKLRESCCKRVREDRNKLLWKLRSPQHQSCLEEKELIKSTFQEIVSHELKKINNQRSCNADVPLPFSGEDDVLWDYDGLHTADQGEREEILLEMQRIFYEDIRLKMNERETEKTVVLDDEDDEFLASAFQEYIRLNDEKDGEQIWCPVCRKGELTENHHFIYCSLCHFKLNRGDEINLALLKDRLAEVHEEHLDRGCSSKPNFGVETVFDLSALYLRCQQCNTFEIVV